MRSDLNTASVALLAGAQLDSVIAIMGGTATSSLHEVKTTAQRKQCLISLFDDLEARGAYPTGGSYSQALLLTLALGLDDRGGVHFFRTMGEGFQTVKAAKQQTLVSWAQLQHFWTEYRAKPFSFVREDQKLSIRPTLRSLSTEIGRRMMLMGNFELHIWHVFRQHKLVETGKGLVCLAPKAVEVGDVLAVFNGTTVPYVLRPTEGTQDVGGTKPTPCFLVGPCYLHGVMQGELQSRRGEEPFSGLRWTRFDGDDVDSLADEIMLV